MSHAYTSGVYLTNRDFRSSQSTLLLLSLPAHACPEEGNAGPGTVRALSGSGIVHTDTDVVHEHVLHVSLCAIPYLCLLTMHKV